MYRRCDGSPPYAPAGVVHSNTRRLPHSSATSARLHRAQRSLRFEEHRRRSILTCWRSEVNRSFFCRRIIVLVTSISR
jgi:hypothetical protein